MVLTGTSSKQQALVSRLAAAQPALIVGPIDSQRGAPARQRQVQRRLTSDQVQQLVTEYEAGIGVQDLATRWSIHRTTVATQLRQAGVLARRRGLTEEARAEAVRLYAEGWSCQRLAERYGCNATTVWSVLRRANVQLRAPWERLSDLGHHRAPL